MRLWLTDLFLDMEVITFSSFLSNINPCVNLIFITIFYCYVKNDIVSFIKTRVTGLLALIKVEVYIIFVAFCLICHPIKVTYFVSSCVSVFLILLDIISSCWLNSMCIYHVISWFRSTQIEKLIIITIIICLLAQNNKSQISHFRRQTSNKMY